MIVKVASNIQLYFRKEPEEDWLFPGDKYIKPLIRQLIRGKKTSGVEKVFLNLCKGFNKLGVEYSINKSFSTLKPQDQIVVLGAGKFSLAGYNKTNPIVAGIALMTHPSEWPSLCEDYPVIRYLQHSNWANNVYKLYYGDQVCHTWPAGIETDKWSADNKIVKSNDILIYNKIRWDKEENGNSLVEPIRNLLKGKGLSYKEIVYGFYKEDEYFNLLKESKAMIFLCEHESQGFACCEALSMNVPVIAWDNGYCLDPNRYKWGDPVMPATSVPFFDERCGERFKDYLEFQELFDLFFDNVKSSFYNPRDYILENLTLEKSAEKMLNIITEAYS
jgi:hypothetical protein